MNPGQAPNTGPGKRLYFEEHSCFECDGGTYKPVLEDYHTTIRGEPLSVPKVPMEKCDKCGHMVIGHDGNTAIDQAIEAKYPGYFTRRRRIE